MEDTMHHIRIMTRLKDIHRAVLLNHALPDAVVKAVRDDDSQSEALQDGMLALYFYTAMNWEDWRNNNETRAGMKRIIRQIDSEFYDREPFEYEELDYGLPTLNTYTGCDWRTRDTGVPMDVVWDGEQINQIR